MFRKDKFPFLINFAVQKPKELHIAEKIGIIVTNHEKPHAKLNLTILFIYSNLTSRVIIVYIRMVIVFARLIDE
ncbi:MAG: hypothetical protein EBT92_05710 [Planctomycetes bacterium]|nr:hypothetical protein [Planctomycetota bacterium]